MRNFWNKYSVDVGLLILILLVALFIRILWLDSIPTNISGDEVTNLSDVYKILFDERTSLVSFMGDGSVAGATFYWMSLFVELFGFENTVFGLRFSVALLSILSLTPFYILLKERTSQFTAFVFTLLLSANYVFLNFSRTAWVNMGIIVSGLFLILFLEKAFRENRKIWYILAGFFAGITLYGYHYGRVFIVGVIAYMLLRLLYKKNRSFQYLNNVFLFATIMLAVFLPFLLSIVSDKAEAILRRPKATYAFAQNNVLGVGTSKNLFQHQLEYVFRGFILLDGKVMSEGIENMRYVPLYEPPVNMVIKALFIMGIFYAIIFERRLSLWWVVCVSVLVTQILSESPPNFSRGLFYIPFSYFISGVFLHKALLFAKGKMSFNSMTIGIPFLIFIGAIFFYDVNRYFSWMKTEQVYNARQPAIDLEEFGIWQKYQIQRIESGQNTVTNYEWYEIRKGL